MRKRIWSDWLGIKGHIEDTRKGKMIEISRQNSYLDKKNYVFKKKMIKAKDKTQLYYLCRKNITIQIEF